MLTGDAFICTESTAARGWKGSPGGKTSDKITRNGPWVLETHVQPGYEVTRKAYSVLINA